MYPKRCKSLLHCYIVITFIISVYPKYTHSQNWELGLFGGFSNYLGDIAPDVKLSESHPAFSIFMKKNLSQYFSLSLGISQAHISGNDQNFSYLEVRNLNFETNIFEISSQLEFNFFPFAFGLDHKRFTPYVFTGISAFKFNPVTTYNGSLVNLVDMDTEGRAASGDKGMAYSLVQFAIPVGCGFKYKLNNRMNIGVLLSYRYCFTDYLDDVSTVYYDKTVLEQKIGQESAALSDRSLNSIGKPGKQRGRPDLKDWYIFSGLFLSYKIKNPDCFKF